MKKINLKDNRISGAVLFIAILSALIFYAFTAKETVREYKTYNEFMSMAEQGKISQVILSDAPQLTFYLKDSEIKYETDNPRNPVLKEVLLLKDVTVKETGYVSTGSVIQSGISMLFMGFAFYMAYRMLSKQSGKSAMALTVANENDQERVQLNLNDIAGNEEAKESVSDIVDFIKNPEKYSKYGARMPKGIIFYGPPGTGKTLMAKAIAGEAGVPFYAVSGSDFVQMYVGVGAARVRELFKKARETGKAVIFIDEIDALGKKRNNQATGGNDEREQTLNALLTEMSGFSSGAEGIVVIAATNRLDTLDSALLRPGRFDRQVEIGLPDFSAREKILALHIKNKPLSQAVNIPALAKQTVYFSGAMLENLVNEAAINAAKKGGEFIEQDDIETAYYTVIAGSEKKDRSGIRQQERKITAYHEAGHALAAKLTLPENTVSKITIIPSTKGAGGFCVNIPPDKMYYTKKELEAQVMVNLAGRAAEEIMFGEENITTGASNDIEKATAIINDFVSKYGMSKTIGLINTNIRECGNAVYEECSALMEKLYDETKTLINKNLDKLKSLAEELLEKETLNEEEINALAMGSTL